MKTIIFIDAFGLKYTLCRLVANCFANIFNWSFVARLSRRQQVHGLISFMKIYYITAFDGVQNFQPQPKVAEKP